VVVGVAISVAVIEHRVIIEPWMHSKMTVSQAEYTENRQSIKERARARLINVRVDRD
jgi:hypothetical protein